MSHLRVPGALEEGKEMGQVGETEDGEWGRRAERISVFSLLSPQPEEEKGVGSRDRNR